MAGKAVPRLRKDHSPRKRGGRFAPPELSVDEIPDASRHQAEGNKRHDEVGELPKADAVTMRVESHDDEDADQAAVRAHAALPDFKNRERVLRVVGGLIKEAVPETSAQDHAEDSVKKEIFHVVRSNAAPGVFRAQATEEPEGDKARQVHESVPANGHGAELQRHGIELGVNQHFRRSSASFVEPPL